MEKVSIVRVDEDFKEAVQKGVQLIGGLNLNKNQHVVIKPNICNAKNPEGIVITDFRIIEAVVKLIHENGNELTIVESDNISGKADDRIKKSGLMYLLDELDVPFLNLSHDDYEEHEVAGTILKIPKTIKDADYFINLPKIKTCAHTLVTLGIKNLYGVFQCANKGKLHKHLDEILPFLAEMVGSDLIIMDGVNCMEGNGPVIGNPICMNLVLASRNLIAMDSVCSRLMGYDPLKISHIALSAKRGIGYLDLDKIEVVGEDWTKHIQNFEKPYSMKATLKSIKAIKDVYLNLN